MELTQELIGRARELAPGIAARAGEADKRRSPPDESIKELCDADLMGILAPKRYGGHELHVDALVGVGREIAAACPSTGWVTAFYIGHNWIHSIFPEKSQDEVFADRPWQLMSGQIAPTARARRVTGGYEVDGRQAWSSGVTHASWVMFTAMVTTENAPPAPTMFMIPRSQVTVHDNWHVTGMRGTGSTDVSVEQVFVPEYHALPLAAFMDGTHAGASVHANPLYKLPGPAVIYCEAMSVMAGIARGATGAFLHHCRDRVTSYTGEGVADKPAVQMRVGRAGAAADAIDDLLDSTTTSIKRYDGSEPFAIPERARLRMRASLVTTMACDAVNDLIHGAGGNAFREEALLQRYFRDINFLRTHAALDRDPTTEMYGRVLFGMDPGTPIV